MDPKPHRISDEELETHLVDFRTRIDNLKLLIFSVEDDPAQRHEETELAASTEAWLMTLRERISEIEEDSPEAFKQRRQLVRLLVQSITVGRDEDGKTRVEVTYSFGPPGDPEPEFVVGVQDSGRSSALKG